MRPTPRRAISKHATAALMVFAACAVFGTSSARAAGCADHALKPLGKALGFVYLDADEPSGGRPFEPATPHCSGPSCSRLPVVPPFSSPKQTRIIEAWAFLSAAASRSPRDPDFLSVPSSAAAPILRAQQVFHPPR